MLKNGVLSFYKRLGETPLQCLNRIREEYPEYKDETLSYAGRLDPLAEGLLLVLVGDAANKNRETYIGLSKTYVVEVLFGISTDTFDLLGLAQDSKTYDIHILQKKIEGSIKNISNFYEMEYPAYSSKPVGGKSLFQWAREGKLNEIKIPKQKGKITQIELISFCSITLKELQEKVQKVVSSVEGTFRQAEVLECWKLFLKKSSKEGRQDFLIGKFTINCESGTYMRSFAHQLGKLVKVPAVAFTILRTKAGDFNILDSVK